MNTLQAKAIELLRAQGRLGYRGISSSTDGLCCASGILLRAGAKINDNNSLVTFDGASCYNPGLWAAHDEVACYFNYAGRGDDPLGVECLAAAYDNPNLSIEEWMVEHPRQ